MTDDERICYKCVNIWQNTAEDSLNLHTHYSCNIQCGATRDLNHCSKEKRNLNLLAHECEHFVARTRENNWETSQMRLDREFAERQARIRS